MIISYKLQHLTRNEKQVKMKIQSILSIQMCPSKYFYEFCADATSSLVGK